MAITAKKSIKKTTVSKTVKVSAKPVVDRKELDKAVELLRPALFAHGGDMEVVEVIGDEVKVRLKGACQGCPMATITLKQGVEKFLLKRVKGLGKVTAA